MKRKGVIIGIALAVVVLGSLAFLFFHDREPRYQGRRLTDWLNDAVVARWENWMKYRVDSPFLTNNPTWLNSRTAIKQMAPDAVPWLLKWFQAKDSSLKHQVAFLVDTQRWLHLHIESDQQRNKKGWEGFRLLGDDARPVWPMLIRMAESPDVGLRWRALQYLCEANLDKEMLLPVLLRALHDPDHAIEQEAARVLSSRYPKEAETAGGDYMFPDIRKELADPRAFD